MTEERKAKTTLLLKRVQAGDKGAADEVFRRLYGELKRMAAAQFRCEAPGHTLQPTALVHEAYLRILDASGLSAEDRTHFLHIAAKAMHRVLIDHARIRHARKRGGALARVPLDASAILPKGSPVDLLELQEALEGLRAFDERMVKVVELRYFSGMTLRETAEALGISPKTVEADWYAARAWLRRELKKGSSP